MYTITNEFWLAKMKEQSKETLIEGEKVLVAPPTKANLVNGKTIVSMFYNNRWYSWELVKDEG